MRSTGGKKDQFLVISFCPFLASADKHCCNSATRRARGHGKRHSMALFKLFQESSDSCFCKLTFYLRSSSTVHAVEVKKEKLKFNEMFSVITFGMIKIQD